MDVNYTELISHPSFGNGLTPKRKIAPGSVIISISSPLLILVEQASLPQICSYCFISPTTNSSAANLTLKRCAACKVPHYCSPQCQKSDWSQIHSKECGILKRLPACPPTPVRALMQMLLKHKTGSSPDQIWAGLEGHVEKFKKEDGKRWEEFMLQTRGAMEFAKVDRSWAEMAVGLLCRMATNAFRVTLPDDTPVGLCFCPPLALVNHSCFPNAAISFDGRTVSLRSITEIKAGEQIYISYIDPLQPREARRNELRQRYFFDCNCDVCRMDETPYQTFSRTQSSNDVDGKEKDQGNVTIWWNIAVHQKEAEQHVITTQDINLKSFPLTDITSLIDQSRNTETPSVRLKSLTSALTLCQSLTTKKLYAIPPIPALINELYIHHLSQESYLEALVLLLFTSLHLDPYTYPVTHHPIRVVRLSTIATLLKHVSSLPTTSLLPPTSARFSESQQERIRNVDYISAMHVFLIFALELGNKSHGAETRFMKEIKIELEDVEEVQRRRGDGRVGMELRRWMMMGEVAVEGKLLAETVVGNLMELSSLVGSVVNGVEV